ncbi:MAG: YibE/F family protein [Actinomycetota bacterium]
MATKRILKGSIILILFLYLFLSLFMLAGCTNEQRRTFGEWEKIEEERVAAGGSDMQYKGKVLEVISDKENRLEGDFISRTQILKVRVTNGPFRGEIIEVQNNIDTTSAYNLIVEEGQGIFFMPDVDAQGDIENAYLTEIIRDNYLIAITVLFFAALVLVGRIKGIRAAISLTLTAAAIFFVMVPLILRGYNPIIISVMVGIGITFISLIIISGPNRKSISAIMGTSGGIMVGGILALIFGNLSHLTGLSNQEAVMLMYIPQDISFDFRGILFAGIILASLGAVMDVSISISSSMLEVVKADPTIRKGRLIAAGMNIGRDIIGTMSNTLILVYIGGAIPLILLFMAYQIPFIDIINQDLIASEIIRAISGTIGLISAIPITVFISAHFYNLRYVRSTRRRRG